MHPGKNPLPQQVCAGLHDISQQAVLIVVQHFVSGEIPAHWFSAAQATITNAIAIPIPIPIAIPIAVTITITVTAICTITIESASTMPVTISLPALEVDSNQVWFLGCPNLGSPGLRLSLDIVR